MTDLAQAFVSLRVDVTKLKDDVISGIKGGASSAAVDKTGQDTGQRLGAGIFTGMVKSTTFGKSGAIATLAAASMATLPAAFAAGGALAGIAFGAKLLIGSKQAQGPLYASWEGFTKTLTGVFASAVTPLIVPLKAAFSQLGSFFRQIGPQIKDVFAAIAPLIQPLVYGLEGLVGGLLPGFVSLMRAAAPAMQAVSGILGTLGAGLGGLFTALAPAVAASSVIFKAIGELLGALLPVIGKIAAAFATSLAPVLVSLFKAFTAIMPAITIFAKILGSLAGAVLSSVVGMIGSLAKLVIQIAPAMQQLAGAFGQAFNALENSGILFTIVNAFEKLVKPVGDLIIALVKGLVPVLPQVIKLWTQVAGILTQAFVVVISALATGLTAIIKAMPPAVLTLIVNGIVAIVVAMKTWAAIQAVVAATNPFILIGVAVAVVAGLVIKYHKQIWDFVTRTWGDVKSFITRIWGDVLTFAKSWWPLLLGPGGLIVKYHNDIWAFIQKTWNAVRNFIKGIWGTISSDASAAWNTIWNNTVTRVSHGVTDVVNFFKGLPGKILTALGNALTTLKAWGASVITGLLNGMTSVITQVWDFIKGIPGKILKFLGITSPPQWAIDAGKHIMNGLGIGMNQAQGVFTKASSASAKAAANAATGAFGGGVQQWRPLVLQALKMEGLPASLVNDVLYQMQTESGGNSRAINLTDSNAAAGDPSRGLLQTIMATFLRWHWPGTSNDIYDPLANIAAAINYSAHGAGFGSGPGQMGSGHGYARGGRITEPIFGVGRSGLAYTFGEEGDEWVTPVGKMGGAGDQLAELIAVQRRAADLLARLTAALDKVPARTAAGVAMAVTGPSQLMAQNARVGAR